MVGSPLAKRITITGDIDVILIQGGFASGTLITTDINGLTDGSYFTVSSSPTSGSAVIDSSSGVWSYYPSDSNFTGQIVFNVTVTDDLGGITEQIITIIISGDDDNDGLYDHEDNCPTISNDNQEDIDSDGLGNVCASFLPSFLPAFLPSFF